MAHEGRFCIPTSSFNLPEVNQGIVDDYLGPNCEEKKGIVTLYRFQVAYTGRGCPYGHEFEYKLEGECYLP